MRRTTSIVQSCKMNAKVGVLLVALLAVQGASAQSISVNIFARVFLPFVNIIEQGVESARQIVQLQLEGLANITEANTKIIQTSLNDTLKRVETVINIVLKTGLGGVPCLQNIVEAISNVFMSIVDELRKFTVSRIKELLELANLVLKIPQAIIEIIKKLVTLSIQDILQAIISNVVPLIREVPSKIPTIITAILGDVIRAVINIFRKLVDIILSILGCLPRPR